MYCYFYGFKVECPVWENSLVKYPGVFCSLLYLYPGMCDVFNILLTYYNRYDRSYQPLFTLPVLLYSPADTCSNSDFNPRSLD
jgi:hypothetical protein